jgi:cell division protein FtsB
MSTISEKRKARKRPFIYSGISIFVLVGIIFFFGFQVFDLREKRDLSEVKRAEAQAELERIKAEAADLRRRNEELGTPDGRERAIRERFNVVKEGEGVIHIIEEDRPLGAGIMMLEPPVLEEKSFFERIMHFFRF